MDKIYSVQLKGKEIGTTRLELADPPMGVVFGKIEFKNIDSGYALFKDHCEKFNTRINTDLPEDNFLDTQHIAELKVYAAHSIEICGQGGTSVTGFDQGGFEISIAGIPYPFYSDEFPDHVNEYQKKSNSPSTTIS